jgi:hypothetical protein
MFDSGYQYRKVQVNKAKDKDVFLTKHIFCFISENYKKYIVEVEEYEHTMFILKFHLKCHNHADDKYSKMTKYKDVNRVLRTCIDIMIEMYKKNPYSSFGFMGANMANEEISNNKRFRVYKGIMERFFSPKRFIHKQKVKKNLYFLINKDNTEPDLEKKIIDTLLSIYNF